MMRIIMKIIMKVCVCALVLLLTECVWSREQYYSDQCSWRGSGLTHQSHVRDVEQVYLRCSEGSLEWIYPTGAVVVNLRPNTSPTHTHAHTHTHTHSHTHTVCLKARPGSSGASVYLQRDGELSLLLSEADLEAGKHQCFNLQQGALFIEATAHTDISKRVTAFQYQLIHGDEPQSPTASCKPCTDEQILMAVCTSDFVVKGSIQAIEDDDDKDEVSLVVSSIRVYRQKKRVFVPVTGGTRRRGWWTGRVKISKKCVAGAEQEAELLLTGSVRFGEAWLGCAPQYKDFLQIYSSALETGSNPCYINTN